MATYLESKTDLSGNEFFFGCERDRTSFLFSLFISLHFTIHYLSVCVHVCVCVYVYTCTCHSYTQLYIYIYMPLASSFKLVRFGSGSGWLGFVGTTVSSTFIAMMMMMMIDRLLLVFEPRLQPCVWTFTNLLVAAVRRSAAAPNPHAALMRTPCGPIATTPTNINWSHITTPTNLQKLVRPKLDQPDHFLRPWYIYAVTVVHIAVMTVTWATWLS